MFSFVSELEQIKKTFIDEMRNIYLRDNKEWCLMFSTGKDSSLVLLLTWLMLASLAPEQRNKCVHVATSNTGVETPEMDVFIRRSLQAIETAAKIQGLPIFVHLGEPVIEKRFFYQVLGKGNPPPIENSRYRWCTDKLKLEPMNQVVQQIIHTSADQSNFVLSECIDPYDLVMHLGVRIQESTSRKRSVEKFAIDDKSPPMRNIITSWCTIPSNM